jgi:hypothetical protein
MVEERYLLRMWLEEGRGPGVGYTAALSTSLTKYYCSGRPGFDSLVSHCFLAKNLFSSLVFTPSFAQLVLEAPRNVESWFRARIALGWLCSIQIWEVVCTVFKFVVPDLWRQNSSSYPAANPSEERDLVYGAQLFLIYDRLSNAMWSSTTGFDSPRSH